MYSYIKKLSLVFILQFLVLIVVANTISLSQAKSIAYKKCICDNKTEYNIISSSIINNEKTAALFYRFDLKPEGYIIVSANDNLPPIIAYSYTNIIDNEGRLEDVIKVDLECRLNNLSKLNESLIQKRQLEWKKYLSNSKQSTIKDKSQQWPAEGTTTTGGWLKTNWHQDSPYNQMCPVDPTTGIRSVSGCPSTVMGQILNYHKTTNEVNFDDSDKYYHNYAGQYWIDTDFNEYGFPSFIQLNKYLDTLNLHYSNNIELTNNDKAALTFACGVAATQVYSSNVSGTFSVSQAYEAYQKFNFDTAALLQGADTSLFTRLKQNMKDSLPAHLAIVNSAWNSGHNVVVDGYNTENYYHLNFGWGGQSNGWYLLPEELPYELTVIEGLIVDIIKNNLLSVNENEKTPSSFMIYPNPTNGIFTIEAEANNTSILEIYNLYGAAIYKKIILDHTETIDLSDLKKGTYLLKIECNNIIETKKIIIQ
ncbi:MAG: C10 family peptidase [Salinivirgaceae bacterium]|nr:C10 family peptidase [Salinivirgaceae bacterium]